MKKFLGFIFLLSLSIFSFSYMNISLDSTTIQIGSSASITINTDAQTIFADVDFGGFNNPDIIFDGEPVKDGKANLIYLAPFTPTEATITFTTDTGESTSQKINITNNVLKGNKISLKVVKLSGPNLYKEKGNDVWNPLNPNIELTEGDEVLVAEKGYLKLSGPNEINIDISENTQMLFSVLREVDKKIDFRYKLKKGVTYNSINKKLLPGSKFIITDNQDVAAGVRGTRFSFESGEKCVVRVYDGVVQVAAQNKSWNINPNNMFIADPITGKNSFDKVDIPEEKFIKQIEKKPEQTTPPKENKEQPKENKETTPQTETKVNNVQFGTIQKDGINYFVYSFSPEFTFGGLSLGIGFSAYQKELGGTLYFGAPSEILSDNILSAITLTRLGMDFGTIYFNYGKSSLYTMAMGMLVNRYYIPYSNIFDVGFRMGGIETFIHIPYEIKKLYPFDVSQSSSMYIANLKSDISGNKLDLNYIYEQNDTSAHFNHAVALAFYRNIFNFKTGIEVDGLMTDKGLGYGGLAGIFFDLPPFLQLTAGLSYSGDNFTPQFIDSNYEYLKNNNKLTVPNNPYGLGIIGNANMIFGDLMKSEISYKKFFNESYDVLSGSLAINIQNAMESLPNLTISGEYMNKNVTSLLDSDTYLKIAAFYPIMGTNGVNLIYSYDAEQGKIVYSVLFENSPF
ncbi:hypothetical protein OSSY52_15230 [Tepiditoga spiralis]|uniref:FecR protein domain-containing protein n=1 Tax=Tepiditoga spiralis TaxID=2108365 RepID=A0A7G1GAV2_9BACT|nr:FecR domain-containing protein [Tepiditoga spiralis]BBE31382.1 hypothetical protein OSSY52_15230 [Tepiditoga spiralis]